MSARRFYREPLLHFAVLGLALFGLYALVGRDHDGDTIVVSRETQAHIEAQQTRRLGRAPTPEELDAGIQAWVDAEILYREGRALSLDRGDPIVRRRLAQKLQFMVEDGEEPPEPSDAQLEQWIAEHPDRFEQAPRFALRHVFVPSASRVTPEAKLRELEAALAEGADPATLGDAFALGQNITAKTSVELDRSFGPEFGARVEALPDHGWHRVRSLYGWHLVHVDERVPGGLAKLEEVRAQARDGLLRELRANAREQAMDELRARYELELPASR